jgi:hypothetical protein
MGYLESLNEIKKARQQRDQSAEDLYKLQMKYIALEREYKATSDTGVIRSTGNDPLSIIEGLKRSIEKGKALSKESIRSVNGLTSHLYEQVKPQQLIEEWKDDIPITLLPVRMETKYRQTPNGIQLMVRIYPDDIAIVTHEKTLTETEYEFGRKHWKLLFNKEGNAQTKRDAWKLLTDKFGINRAVWVAKETMPINWDVNETLTTADELNFDEINNTKPDSWTEAAHTRVLPDRFVLTGYRNGKEVFTQVGLQVKDVVIAGPTPIVDENDPSFTRNEVDNRIQYGEDYAWIADFNLAVREGMGFVIPQSKEDAAQGYDQLLVLGLKLSADENDSKQLMEDLIDNHKYSMEGMSLLKQGTPTNNTESEDAGYQSQQSIDDLMLQVETGQQLFSPTNNPKEASDGQRLAEYLGLDYSVFQTVQNSQISDHAEAIAMNTALHPGTLGYFTSTMLNGVFTDTDRNLLRSHFINYVSGRGPLPAIRVGNQPYGIIVTSDFYNWQYPRKRYEYLNNISGQDTFYEKMYQVLHYMTGKWKEKTAGLAQITKNGNAGESLLKILGLNPGSVEFFQRTGYTYDYLSDMEGFGWGGKYFMDNMLRLMESYQVTQLLTSLGYSTKNDDGSLKTPPMLLEIIFQHYHTTLDKKNIVDTEPLSEESKIKQYSTDSDHNYIDWLIANAANETSLESQDFGDGKMPKSLLFMMLKNGLLLETNHSIFKYLATKDIHASELIRSRKFMNMSTSPSVSPWEIYKAPVNQLISSEVSNKTLFNHVHTSILDTHVTINLEENKQALGKLKNLPTAHLQRAFTEHLDILSYRLDAWQSSLFDQRINTQRNLSAGIESRKTGIYLGSYGYLENVKMRNTRKRIDESVLPESLKEQEDNLFIENENGGFVHAPSLNHATAAAILRNGYLTHASKDDAEALSVNLSSERVRRAKVILEGIRNGQTLEALLGYQFERGLHEWSTRKLKPVILNQLKPEFRKAFPIKKTKVPQEGKTTGPEEITEEFTVVNGLALANVITDFPFGIPNLPLLDEFQIKALNQEKKQLNNTLDAVKDLLTAESAYQMASGNFERAAAVMQAVSNGNIPPEIEVINTARSTQMTFTNRIVLHFDAAETSSPWPLANPLSLKSNTEPALNNWIGKILGSPEDIICSVTAIDADGNNLKKPDLTEIKGKVSLGDLKLQPLDFVLLIRNQLETTGASELESRIRQFFLLQQSLSDDVLIKITFTDTGIADLSKKSFAEILPFANYIRQLISNGKPLQARDFVSTSEVETIPDLNPGNIDWLELKSRTADVYNQTKDLINQLNDAITAIEISPNNLNINTLRTVLKDFADAGFVFAFPKSVTDTSIDSAKLLTEQGKAVLLRFSDTEKIYTAKLLKVDAVETSVDHKVSLLTELIKALLGEDFMVLPKYSFNNPLEIQASASSADQLLAYAKKPSDPGLGDDSGLNMTFPVAEFLHSSSLVRPKMHTLEMVRLLHQNFNDLELEAQPMQIPFKVKDSWLAVEFPKKTEILQDTIAYVQYTPQGFDPNAVQCGILLDEWTETIPNPEEVTGITFNYNQPNSTPPQAILLAVTPNETGNWTWENLTNTILNTFERAKQRAVEPDDIDKMASLTTLLPATMAEFSANRFTNVSLDYSMNILYKFLEVQTLETKQ